MTDESSWIYDRLAAITADLDQAQAGISEKRALFPENQEFQLECDRMLSRLNSQRDMVRATKRLADVFYQD